MGIEWDYMSFMRQIQLVDRMGQDRTIKLAE